MTFHLHGFLIVSNDWVNLHWFLKFVWSSDFAQLVECIDLGPCIPNFRVEFRVGTSRDEFGKARKTRSDPNFRKTARSDSFRP